METFFGIIVLILFILFLIGLFKMTEQLKDNVTGKTAKDISNREIAEEWRMTYLPEIENIKKKLEEATRIPDKNKIELHLDELENISSKLWAQGLHEDSEDIDIIISNYYNKYLNEE